MINSLKIYSWEIIKRSPLWYIIFFVIIIWLISLSFFQWWLAWWVSVLFIFLIIIVSYVIVYLYAIKKTVLKIYDSYFDLNEKKYFFSELLWFNIGLDSKWDFSTFIIIPRGTNYPLKYTIIDDNEKIKKVVDDLIKLGLDVYSDYENDKLYKIITFLKLW